jgi:uncharacterized protein
MKNIISAVVLFFILLFAFVKLVGPLPFSLTSVVTQKTDFFTVTGEGKVTMVPDIAVLTAGVQAQGATVKIIQDEINLKTGKITEAIKRLGVESKDIRTSNYSISPTYDYRSGSARITGYQANSTLTIKVRAIDKVNSIIDSATANGANEIGSVLFDVSDKTKWENQARDEAVQEAKAKAQAAMKSAGFSLGRVVNYSESDGSTPRPMPMYAKADSLIAGGGAPATTVEPGSSEITMTVTLSYEIR